MTANIRVVSFPARLLVLRERAGLTRYALARRAGLAPIHLTRIEQGLCDPKTATVQRLAAALGVEVAELI